MGTLKMCPTCNYKPGWRDSGLMVKQCKNPKCGGYFCRYCPKSNEGRRCPHCYSENFADYERIRR